MKRKEKDIRNVKKEEKNKGQNKKILSCRYFNAWNRYNFIIHISQVTLDGRVNYVIYVPIIKPYQPDSEFDFRSYWILTDCIQTRVKGKKDISSLNNAMYELQDFAKEYEFSIISPFYFIFKHNDDTEWIEVKAKVFDES